MQPINLFLGSNHKEEDDFEDGKVPLAVQIYVCNHWWQQNYSYKIWVQQNYLYKIWVFIFSDFEWPTEWCMEMGKGLQDHKDLMSLFVCEAYMSSIFVCQIIGNSIFLLVLGKDLFIIFSGGNSMWCSILKGGFVDVGFLRYRWKHPENNKEDKSFWSFLNCKIWMPWSVLINKVSF